MTHEPPHRAMTSLQQEHDAVAQMGQLADDAARKTALYRYLEKRAKETLRRQRADLRLFQTYLTDINVPLKVDIDVVAWTQDKTRLLDLTPFGRLSAGLVEGFIQWQIAHDYDVDSVNVRFSTVRTYCRIATQAGYLPEEVFGRIRLIETYRGREAINLDATRDHTRREKSKKAEANVLSKEQIALLKQQPDTPQGRRDTVILTLFLDHGFRCGELANLKRSNIHMEEQTLMLYREKVNRTQTHALSRDTVIALTNYFAVVALSPDDQLLTGSQKGMNGSRMHGGMSKRAITARMNTLGKKIGIKNLSSHDGRDTWATWAARGGTQVNDLVDAGGWSNVYTPYNKYVKPAKIANKGIKLDY